MHSDASIMRPTIKCTPTRIYENENKEDVNEQTREISFIKTSTPFRVYVSSAFHQENRAPIPSALRAIVCMSIIQSDI